MPENLKYELTNERITLPATSERPEGIALYRIRALRNFYNVNGSISAGTLGGFVESYDNLSQDDSAWIADDAMVYDNAWVSGKSHIEGNAQIFGNAKISDEVWVKDNSKIFGNAQVSGNVYIEHNVYVSGDAKISNKKGRTHLDGGMDIDDSAIVESNADVLFVKGFPTGGLLYNENITFFRTSKGEIRAYTLGLNSFPLSELGKEIAFFRKDDAKVQKEIEMLIQLVQLHFSEEN